MKTTKLQNLRPESDSQALSFKTWAACVALFAVALALLFKDFVFDGQALLASVFSDQMKGFGVRYLRDSIFVAQWNPYILGGMPTYDALFGDALHPFVLLERIMSPERAIGFAMIGSVWMAFAAALPLFALLGRSWKVGALIALLYALNPQFVTHLAPGHDGKMMVIGAMPLALWGLFLLTRSGKWIGAFWIALGVALMILSSQLQTTYYVLFGMLAISLFENFVRAGWSAWKTGLVRQVWVGLGVAVGLAICAAQILPPMEYTQTQSIRATAEKTSLEHATSYSIHPEEAASMILPSFVGNLPDMVNGEPVKNTYWGVNGFKLNHDAPGMMLVLLAALGFAASNRRKEHALWAWMLVVTLVYSLGAHTPWFQFFYEYLPKAKMFRAPSIALIWIPMLLAMVAAQWAGDYRRGEAVFSKVAIAVAVLIAGLLALLRGDWMETPAGYWTVLVLASVVLIAGRLGQESLGLPFRWQTLLTSIVPGLKKSPLKILALTLPVLALLPIHSSMHVMNNKLSEAMMPAEQWTEQMSAVMKAMQDEVYVSFFVFAAIAGLLMWALRQAQTWNMAWLVLAIVGGAEAWFVNSKFAMVTPRDSAEAFAPQYDETAARLRQMAPADQWRYWDMTGQALKENYAPYYKLRSVTGFHDNEPASYRALTKGKDRESTPPIYWMPEASAAMQMLLAQGLDSAAALAALGEGEPTRAELLSFAAQLLARQQNQDPQAIFTALMADSVQAQSILTQVAPMYAQQRASATGEKRLVLGIQAGLNPFVNILGVKAIVMDPKAEKPVQNDSAFSRLRGYAAYTVAPDSTHYSMLASGHPYKSSILLDKAPTVAPGSGVVEAKLTQVLSPSEYLGEVKATQAGIVLFNENYSPYWNVKVNGNPAKTYRAFGTFLAFEVPQGDSKVEIEYDSAPLAKAAWISYAGLVALLGLLLAGVAYAWRSRQGLARA